MSAVEFDLDGELRAHVARKYRTQKAAAAAWGLSTAYVSAVITGRKQPNQQILDDAGIVRKVVYEFAKPRCER